jgi:O-antigen/teichoic acid export membrane protein
MIRRALSQMQRRWSHAGVSGVLLRGSTLSFALSTIGYGASYLLQLLFARWLGPREYGVLSYSFAWISIGLIVGKLGFDLALVRYVPEYRITRRWGELRGLLRVGRWLPVAWGCLLALCASMVTLAVTEAALRVAAILACWLIPCGIMLELNSSALRGFKRVIASLIGDSVLRPVLSATLFAATFALGFAPATSVAALGSYGGATLLIAVAGSIWLRGEVRQHLQAVQPSYHVGKWLRTSLPMMLAAGFQVLLYSVDTLMVGHYVGTTAAGFYSVASKVALLTLFAMNAAQVVAGPMMAEAFTSGTRVQLQKIVSITIWLSLLVAVPCAGALMLFGGTVLSAFGSDFRSASGALWVLTLAQVLNVATGPVGLLLSMGGYQRQLVGLLGLGVVSNVVANIAWIPAYGLMGAAYAALVAQVLWNLCAVVFIRRSMSIDCTLLSLRAGGARADEGS